MYGGVGKRDVADVSDLMGAISVGLSDLEDAVLPVVSFAPDRVWSAAAVFDACPFLTALDPAVPPFVDPLSGHHHEAADVGDARAVTVELDRVLAGGFPTGKSISCPSYKVAGAPSLAYHGLITFANGAPSFSPSPLFRVETGF